MAEFNQDTSFPPERTEEEARARRKQQLIEEGADEETLRPTKRVRERMLKLATTIKGASEYETRLRAEIQLALLDAMAWVKR